MVVKKRINSREKGKDGEREFAKHLVARGYKEARRGQQFDGTEGRDVVTSVEGVHFEVKRRETVEVWPFMRQAMGDAQEGEVPVVAWRRNHHAWLAILTMDDYLELHQKAYGKQVRTRTRKK